MRTELLNYDLPEELVAQHPSDRRSGSRLLVMNRCDGTLSDRVFCDVIEYVQPGDCLVLNNTKVLPARFYAQRTTGAALQGLFLEEAAPHEWLVMLKNARKIKVGESIHLLDRNEERFCTAKAIERLEEGRWRLGIDLEGSAEDILGRIGFAPLPPYIKRRTHLDDEQTRQDIQRYQTVYAQPVGAVAAPTAGLHFSEELFERLVAKGVRLAYVTLHVGAGTFKPVTAENLDDHQIHSEWYCLDEENAGIINRAVEEGRRIIAVGTTSVRTLETIADDRKVSPAAGSTRLFIQQGYEFKIVDAMITNFHLPKSTLLALVGAFAGLDEMLKAYQHAIDQKYRFYSYGDAMLIL